MNGRGEGEIEREYERNRGRHRKKTSPIKRRLQLLPVQSAARLYNLYCQPLMI